MATFVRPYAWQNDEEGKHRKAGPAVTERPTALVRPASHMPRRATSADLISAYEVVNSDEASGAEIGCACEVITEHSLTGEA
jgi:hypothetical protein